MSVGWSASPRAGENALDIERNCNHRLCFSEKRRKRSTVLLIPRTIVSAPVRQGSPDIRSPSALFVPPFGPAILAWRGRTGSSWRAGKAIVPGERLVYGLD